MSDELIRAEFEKIISKASLSRGKYLRQDYDSAATQFAWEMWQKCWPVAFAAGLESRPTPEQSGEALSPNELSALLPGCYYMDPPDGGSVTLLEQLQRMAQDAARYRWLRDTYRLCYYAQCLPPSFGFARVIGPGTLDIEIDRAIAAIDRSALGREG